MKGIFVYVLEFMLTLHKFQNSSSLMRTKFEIWRGQSISKVIQACHTCTVRIVLYIGLWPSSQVSKKINMYSLNDPTTGPEHPIYRTICTI